MPLRKSYTEDNGANNHSYFDENKEVLERWNDFADSINAIGETFGHSTPGCFRDKDFYDFMITLITEYNNGNTGVDIENAPLVDLWPAEKLDVIAAYFSTEPVGSAYHEILQKYRDNFYKGLHIFGAVRWADILCFIWADFQENENIVYRNFSPDETIPVIFSMVDDTIYEVDDLKELSAKEFIEEFPVSNAINILQQEAEW